MRGKADSQEAALIVMNVRSELAVTGKLLTGTALAPLGCKEVVIRYGEHETRSAGDLVTPKLPVDTMSGEQGPPGSRRSKEQGDAEQDIPQPEKPMEQDPNQAGRDDDKASQEGASSLDFIFLDEDETETVVGTSEPA